MKTYLFFFSLLFLFVSQSEPTKGIIILNDNSIQEVLIHPASKVNEQSQQVLVQVNNDLITYSPGQIKGYIVDNRSFISYSSDSQHGQTYFSEIISEGHIQLIKTTVEEGIILYGIRKGQGAYFHEIEILEKNKDPVFTNSYETGEASVRIKTNVYSYQEYFLELFAECSAIKAKLLDGEYRASQLEEMVRIYNNCLTE
ncbi:MAG: hypothetical protein AAF587_25145 [Bacteroidota bacterium]